MVRESFEFKVRVLTLRIRASVLQIKTQIGLGILGLVSLDSKFLLTL